MEALTAGRSDRVDEGFTLVEVMVAMLLLTIGALAMAAGVALGARRLTGTQDQFLASERAAEAVESVFKARDNRTIVWAQIRNVIGSGADSGGIFIDGARDVRLPGVDGLVNTVDDGAIEAIVKPGPDGLLGSGDDIVTPMYGFTREIEIRELGPTLRRLRVVVRYRSANGTAQYVLTTYISAYA